MIYNVSGDLVKEEKVQGERMEINLSDKAKGTYYVQVVRKGKGLFNQRVIIQ